MKTQKLALFVLIFVALTACQPAGPSVKDQASTMVAQTAAAIPPSATPTIAPTETTAPSPTVTLTPTITVTPTPTGPLKLTDDFSEKSNIWGACDKCDWKDGKLYFGPFPPRGNGLDQVYAITCEVCGEHTYFRIAADLTFFDGIGGDRTFGVGLVELGKFYAGTSIATSQIGAIEAFDFTKNQWTGSKYARYGAIKPGTITNHLEFTAKPNASGGTDFSAIINGKSVIILTDIIKRSTKGLKPAIYVGWHSIGITVDNFEYEEIEPSN